MKINPKLLERLSQSNINTDTFCKKMEESQPKKKIQPEQFLGCSNSNFRVRVLNEDMDQSQKKIDAMSTATSGFYKAPEDMSNSLVKSRIIKMQQSMVQSKQINVKPPQPKRPLIIQRPSSQGPKPQLLQQQQQQQQAQPKVLSRILLQRGSINQDAINSNNNSMSNSINTSLNNPTQSTSINLRRRIMTARQEEEKPLKLITQINEEVLEEITKKSVSEFYEISKFKLRFDSTNDSLDILGDFLPGLIELKLNNSIITSLRDLGTRLRHLRLLWINYSHLRDISGIEMGMCLFQGLMHFHIQKNFIAVLIISKIQVHQHFMNLQLYIIKKNIFLKVIDLECNDIDDLEQVEYLDTLSGLESVNLNGNPIMKSKGDQIRKILVRAQLVEEEVGDNESQIQEINNGENLERLYGLLEDMDIGDVNEIRRQEKEMSQQIFNEPSEQELLALQIKEKQENVPEVEQRPKTAGLMRTKSTIIRQDNDQKGGKEEQKQQKQQVLMPDPKSDMGNTGVAFSGNPLKMAKEKKKKNIRDDQKSLDIVQLIRSSRIYK